MPFLLTLAVFLPPIVANFPQQVDTLQTVAERSGYKATARHGDVVALCKELARRHPDAAVYQELGHRRRDVPCPC